MPRKKYFFVYFFSLYLLVTRLGLVHPEATQQRACFDNSTASLGAEVIGEWKQSAWPDDSVPFLSNSSDVDDWFKTACPAELITASCFLRNRNRALAAQQRHFIPKDCLLDAFTEKGLLEKLENRKVLMIFDGIMKQWWSHLACRLRLIGQAEFKIEWVQGLSQEELKSCPRGGLHCRFTFASVYFPAHKTTLLYQHILLHGKMSHKRLDIIGMFKSLGLKKGDLVIANFGHNFHDDGHIYRNFLRKFSDDYEYGVVKMQEAMPAMLWVEVRDALLICCTNNLYYIFLSISLDICAAFS